MSRSALTLVAVVLLASAPLPGHAFDQPGCGGNWTGSRSCRFTFKGLPVTLYADAVASSGSAQVHIWISPGGSPEVPLLECSATASGFTSCGDETPNDGLPNLPPQAGISLQCNGQGRSSGTYYCSSGLNDP